MVPNIDIEAVAVIRGEAGARGEAAVTPRPNARLRPRPVAAVAAAVMKAKAVTAAARRAEAEAAIVTRGEAGALGAAAARQLRNVQALQHRRKLAVVLNQPAARLAMVAARRAGA